MTKESTITFIPKDILVYNRQDVLHCSNCGGRQHLENLVLSVVKEKILVVCIYCHKEKQT